MPGLLSFKRGQAAELLVAAAALSRGGRVVFNYDPYDTWDLQIDDIRYQVKLSYKRSDRSGGSTYVDIIRTSRWDYYEPDAADALAVVEFNAGSPLIHVFEWDKVYELGRISLPTLLKVKHDTWTIQ